MLKLLRLYVAGDSGYPLHRNLMTPISNPTTPAEQAYNSAHAKTRVIIEQTFGAVKSRFRAIDKSGGVLLYKPVKCAKIIGACFWLHNICVERNIPYVPHADEQPFVGEDHVPVAPPQAFGNLIGTLS